LSRRRLLAGAGAVGAAAAAQVLSPAASAPVEGSATQGGSARQRAAYRIRETAARTYRDAAQPVPAANGDEERYGDKRASFAKTLPHDDSGEVDPAAYARWQAILESGDPSAFERVPRAPSAVARLNDPQAAYAFELAGADGAAVDVAVPPRFASAEMAAEMAEVYWQALTIDVPFREYDSDPLARAAAAELSRLRALARAGLFRGETAGDRIGPYLSQFLLLDVPYGIATIEQRYRFPTRGQSFLTDTASWLAAQRGEEPAARLRIDATPRYIASARELVEYVHKDFSFQAYMNAALIMLRLGDDALSPTNPYRFSRTQFGDITLGGKNVLSLLAQAALLGQKGAYYHKWLVHRRLRPEAYGGRIDAHLRGRKSYDLHADILGSEAVARASAAHGTALLPVAYPEGSPTHPAYPAAHGSNAGACATILKAFFAEDFVIPQPMEAVDDGAALAAWHGAPLTLGHEIDKLASNITLARDAAGVHYRSDGIAGLRVGEAQAIGLLRDVSRTYNERFDGFVLTRFDGQRIRIADGDVAPIQAAATGARSR
jgi:hypothetical protein